MQLIDLLNQLEQAGTLGQLYAAGLLNIKSYNYRELVGVYRALLASPTYADQPGKAVRATAAQCRVARRTVYTAIREMERAV